MAHARLGPSNVRWPQCPGSIREEAAYPNISGEAAIDGTGTHLLLELVLTTGNPVDSYCGQIIGINDRDKPGGWLVDQKRIDRVQMCLDYINRRETELAIQFPGAKIFVESESKADPGGYFGRADWWGTVDITITVLDLDDNCLFVEVIDYKDGRMWVSEKGNTQLLSYLGGKMRPYVGSGPGLNRPFNTDRVRACRVTIVQPKTSPPIRYDDVTPVDVMDKMEQLSIAAHATDKHDAPLVPGKHCQWCKHKPNCKAQSKKSVETMSKITNDIAVSDDKSLFEYLGNAIADPKNLTVDQLTQLMDARSGVEAIFDSVENEIITRIESGEEIPGYAMEPGNSTKVWNEPEDEIVKTLKGRRMKKDSIYPPKLLTPAQFLKCDCVTDEQRSKIEKQFISVKAGNLKLKKVAKKKPVSMFDDIPESKPVSFF